MNKQTADDDDMLPEYDFSKMVRVRNRHAHLVGCGRFRLAAELHPHFETSGQVDKALRQWVAEHRPRSHRGRTRHGPASSAGFVHQGVVRGFWFARDLVPFFPTEASVNAALSEWLAEHPPRRRRAARTRA
jgi:hypothetical protein